MSWRFRRSPPPGLAAFTIKGEGYDVALASGLRPTTPTTPSAWAHLGHALLGGSHRLWSIAGDPPSRTAAAHARTGPRADRRAAGCARGRSAGWSTHPFHHRRHRPHLGPRRRLSGAMAIEPYHHPAGRRVCGGFARRPAFHAQLPPARQRAASTLQPKGFSQRARRVAGRAVRLRHGRAGGLGSALPCADEGGAARVAEPVRRLRARRSVWS